MGFISLFLLFWLPVCFLVAWLARQKGRSGTLWFLLSVFLSPIIGMLAVIAVPVRVRPTHPSRVFKPVETAPASKKCAACAETILAEAKRCRYCGADQPEVAMKPIPTMGYCPGCSRLRSSLGKCLYCANTAPVLTSLPTSDS